MSVAQTGPFRAEVVKHLELRRSMGQLLKGDEYVLRRFDDFAREHSPEAKVLTRELVVGFLDRNRQFSPTTQMHKVVTLRQFARSSGPWLAVAHWQKLTPGSGGRL